VGEPKLAITPFTVWLKGVGALALSAGAPASKLNIAVMGVVAALTVDAEVSTTAIKAATIPHRSFCVGEVFVFNRSPLP